MVPFLNDLNKFYVWLTLHLQLYLYSKQTRCTIYLHFNKLPYLYVSGPFVAHHQEATSVYVTNGVWFSSKSFVEGPGPPTDDLEEKKTPFFKNKLVTS
jgi:hypothetical protein